MRILGIALGVLIGLSIIGCIITQQWVAIIGWIVAGLEWTRRLTVT